MLETFCENAFNTEAKGKLEVAFKILTWIRVLFWSGLKFLLSQASTFVFLNSEYTVWNMSVLC